MSKELPYFKFFTSEWLNGDITLEDFELQGLFISVCAYYWHKDCIVKYDQLEKKFRNENLIDLVSQFVKVNEETNYITIDFLDEQHVEFADRKKKLSLAGKKGAQRKALLKKEASIKPPLNHPLTIREDKEKDNIKIIKDKIKFSFKISLSSLGINENLIDEYLKVRKSKKLTNSKTAFEAIEREFNKIDITPQEIIKTCVENSWGGFKAEWIKNKQTNGLKKHTSNNNARTTTAERQNFE